jgi:putative endopeptidase
MNRRLALSLAAALAACGHASKQPTTSTTRGSAAGSAVGSATTPAGSASASGSEVTEPAEPPGPPATQITLAEAGLEADSMDRTADPCQDFYQFACGGWMQKNEIPEDRPRWGRFGEIDERNEATLHQILEDARSTKQSDPVMTKLGAFYGSCMDEKAVEKQGLSGIKPLLDAIAKVKDPKSLGATIALVQSYGLGVGFEHATEPDFKDSTTNMLWIDSGGLGLPDRDYYLKDDFKDKLTAYHDHLVRLFELLGRKDDQAATAAAGVIALETELAKVTRTATERRDPVANYHPMPAADLAKLAPGLDWAAFQKAIGATPQQQIDVTNPDYFTALSTLLTSQKPAVWQDYLTVRVVDGSARTLPKRFDDERFALEQALSGVKVQKERWKRCVDATGGAMPEYLGQPFVAKVFPGDSKKYANDLYAAIADAMGKDLDSLDWMSPETKAAAHKKLAKVQFMTGYPDKWKTYDFKVAATTYTANALAASKFEDHRQAGKAGKPYDRTEWLMPAYIVNAYYNPQANNTALPAGILEPPFFSADRSIAANMGGIGMVAGHELTHAFDDQGAQFDEEGRLSNWWQPSDLEKFKAKGACVAAQYSTFEALPGKFVQGKLTLGENIADLGGVKNAFSAYRAKRKGADKVYVADGFTEDQQFFLGAAQAWCSKDREAEIQRRLATDPHSPPKFRVYGALRNLPEFAKAWSCKPGTPYHPKNACSVW